MEKPLKQFYRLKRKEKRLLTSIEECWLWPSFDFGQTSVKQLHGPLNFMENLLWKNGYKQGN